MSSNSPTIATELISILTENSMISELTAAAVEAIIVPFQRSTEVEFLAISVPLRSDKSTSADIETAVEMIVDTCKQQVEASELWGVDVLVSVESANAFKKILRVMLPKSTLAKFSAKGIPTSENRNFSESEFGVIWYEKI